MVATVIHDDVATFANVGDSRGYHLRNGLLVQITKDHSLVARLVEEGAISEAEAANHPRKNVILHSLGSEDTPQIDIFNVDLAPGEQLILCSDGLTRHVADGEIAAIVKEYEPAQATFAPVFGARETKGDEIAGKRNRRALLLYTLFLCFVQIALIFLIWLSVSG